MHSEIAAPVFLMFLSPNDLVLINYHFVPIVITYFRHFCHFTHWGWLYKLPYNFCNPNIPFMQVFPRLFILGFILLSSLFSFFHFLGCRTHPLMMKTQGMLG